jgi:azurin
MKMTRLILLALTIVLTVAGATTDVAAQAGRTIQLTGNDSLQYSLTTITAKPGERLTVVLRTMSMQPAAQMAHNFVILKPGANVDQFTMMAGMARDHGYIPPQFKSQILVATDLVAANESTKATFTAPTKPGTYTYFCTYPAHFSGGMKGTLIVK